MKEKINPFTAHCRPRSCGRQRAVSLPSRENVSSKRTVEEGMPACNN